MRKSTFLSLILLLVIMVSNSANADQKFYKFGAADVASAWFPLGSALSTLVTDQVKGVVLTTTFGGAVKNANVVNDNPQNMGFSFGGTTYDAFNGLPPFKSKKQNIRGMFTVGPWVLQIAARADSGNNSIREMIKKKLIWSPSEIGFGTEIAARRVFRAYGTDYEKLKKEGSTLLFVGRKEQSHLMQNRQLDCLFTMSPPPHPILIELETFMPIHCLALEPEVLNTLLTKYHGYIDVTIPAGCTKAQKQAVKTIGEVMYAICHKDVPNDVAYAVTKTFWENQKQIEAAFPAIKRYLDPQKPVRGITVPLHPGAVKYYKEKNIKID